VHEMAARIDTMLKDAIETSRNLSHELSPALLYQTDIGETLEWLAEQIQTKHGLVVHVHTDGEVDSDSDALKAFLYKARRRCCSTWSSTHGFQRPTCGSAGRAPASAWSSPTAGGVRPAGAEGRHRVRALQHPRAGGTAGREDEDQERQGQGQHVLPRDCPMGAGVGGRVAPSPSDEEHAERSGSGTRRRRLRVLVADDHEVVRQGCRPC
jgi:hypothetical protein